MKHFDEILSGFDEMLKNAKSGSFDEVLNKTKGYAEKATQKGADGIEFSRKKLELMDTKAKLSKAYEAYGKAQYEALEGAPIDEEALQTCIAEIELNKTRAELLEEELAAVKMRFTGGNIPEEK